MTRHTVLVPIDGSRFSRQIVPYVQRLLPPHAYTLTLLRVATPPRGLVAAPPRQISSFWPIMAYASAGDAAREHHPIFASQQEQSLSAALITGELPLIHQLQQAGYTVAMEVRFGDPVAEIVGYVKQTPVAIVAMATHSWTGLRHLVLGSIAEQVMRELSIPVLLVRPFDTLAPRAAALAGGQDDARL